MVKKYGPWRMYKNSLGLLFLITVLGKAAFQRPNFSINGVEAFVLVAVALLFSFVEYAVELGKISQQEAKKEAARADKRQHTSVQRGNVGTPR